MSMLSFEEFHEEIGNEGAREVLGKGLGLLKRANKATDNFINKNVNVGKFGDMTTDQVGQAIKQSVQKGTQRVKQTTKKVAQQGVATAQQAGKQAVQTIIKNSGKIEGHLKDLSEAGDKISEVVSHLPTAVQAAITPELTLVKGAINLSHDVFKKLNDGESPVQVVEHLSSTVHNVIKAARTSDKKLEAIANALYDSTEKGKVEKARKKLKEMVMTAAKILGMIGGGSAVSYTGYKGYQKVTGSNEDFYALEDITDSNYSEITELLTEVKHIIDTSTSTNDLYSKLQHLEKAKR